LPDVDTPEVLVPEVESVAGAVPVTGAVLQPANITAPASRTAIDKLRIEKLLIKSIQKKREKPKF
jgi:hypothetical protein